MLADELREHVHARLRERRLEPGVVRDEDGGGAEPPGPGRERLDARAGHDRRDLAAQLRRLGEHGERRLQQLVAVVLEEDERARH